MIGDNLSANGLLGYGETFNRVALLSYRATSVLVGTSACEPVEVRALPQQLTNILQDVGNIGKFAVAATEKSYNILVERPTTHPYDTASTVFGVDLDPDKSLPSSPGQGGGGIFFGRIHSTSVSLPGSIEERSTRLLNNAVLT